MLLTGFYLRYPFVHYSPDDFLYSDLFLLVSNLTHHTHSHLTDNSLPTPGALFGASLGSNIGAKNAIDRARKEEMERMGITAEMLEGARDIGLALERSMEGLQAIRTSLETQQQFARRLDADADQLYAKAKSALESGNEDASRLYLLDRTKVMDKLKEVLKRCAEENVATSKWRVTSRRWNNGLVR